MPLGCWKTGRKRSVWNRSVIWSLIRNWSSASATSSWTAPTDGLLWRTTYGLPQSARGLDHDLAYRGLAAGDIDVMDLYSTDAEIDYYGLRVLVDDRAVFPRYDARVSVPGGSWLIAIRNT